MKRLIFMHIGRTGGSSMMKWLNPGMKLFIFAPDKLKPGKEGIESAWKQMRESQIIQIHGGPNLMQYIGADRWNNLLSESIRLCIIRNPIDQYESIWRSAFDRRSPTYLPFVPSAVQAPKPGGNNINLGCYFTQKESGRVDINEWFDLAHEIKHGGLNLTHQTPEEISHMSPYFNNRYDEFIESIFAQNICQNKHYYTIVHNIGYDFIHSPRSRESDIFFASEILNESFAHFVANNIKFRQFTKYHSQPNITASQVIEDISKKVYNNTKSLKDNNDISLSASNRYKFFLDNRIDFTLWQSVIEYCNNEVAHAMVLEENNNYEKKNEANLTRF